MVLNEGHASEKRDTTWAMLNEPNPRGAGWGILIGALTHIAVCNAPWCLITCSSIRCLPVVPDNFDNFSASVGTPSGAPRRNWSHGGACHSWLLLWGPGSASRFPVDRVGVLGPLSVRGNLGAGLVVQVDSHLWAAALPLFL